MDKATELDFKKSKSDKGQEKDRSSVVAKRKLRNNVFASFLSRVCGDPYGN